MSKLAPKKLDLFDPLLLLRHFIMTNTPIEIKGDSIVFGPTLTFALRQATAFRMKDKGTYYDIGSVHFFAVNHAVYNSSQKIKETKALKHALISLPDRSILLDFVSGKVPEKGCLQIDYARILYKGMESEQDVQDSQWTIKKTQSIEIHLSTRNTVLTSDKSFAGILTDFESAWSSNTAHTAVDSGTALPKAPAAAAAVAVESPNPAASSKLKRGRSDDKIVVSAPKINKAEKPYTETVFTVTEIEGALAELNGIYFLKTDRTHSGKPYYADGKGHYLLCDSKKLWSLTGDKKTFAPVVHSEQVSPSPDVVRSWRVAATDPPSATDLKLTVKNLQITPGSRTPVIIVPDAPTAMLNHLNAEDFLGGGDFKTVDEKRSSGAVAESIFIINKASEKNRGKNVPFHVTCDPQTYLKTETDWNRVIAVFAFGKDWQFSDWFADWKKPVEIFNKAVGFFVRYDDTQPNPTVASWKVHNLLVGRKSRHHDRSVANDFWVKVLSRLEGEATTRKLLY